MRRRARLEADAEAQRRNRLQLRSRLGRKAIDEDTELAKDIILHQYTL